MGPVAFYFLRRLIQNNFGKWDVFAGIYRMGRAEKIRLLTEVAQMSLVDSLLSAYNESGKWEAGSSTGRGGEEDILVGGMQEMRVAFK